MLHEIVSLDIEDKNINNFNSLAFNVDSTENSQNNFEKISKLD
jgi:hypothetical protein